MAKLSLVMTTAPVGNKPQWNRFFSPAQQIRHGNPHYRRRCDLYRWRPLVGLGCGSSSFDLGIIRKPCRTSACVERPAPPATKTSERGLQYRSQSHAEIGAIQF